MQFEPKFSYCCIVLSLDPKYRNQFYDGNQVGRVVKAPDLSSGPRMGTWVQAPHLVYPLTMILSMEKTSFRETNISALLLIVSPAALPLPGW